MYDFKLNRNEKIKLISDNTLIHTSAGNKELTCIITNQRMLILDYPSGMYNSAEDLRISGKISYIRKKEMIEEINLEDIKSIIKENNHHKLELINGNYININDDDIIDYLDNILGKN